MRRGGKGIRCFLFCEAEGKHTHTLVASQRWAGLFSSNLLTLCVHFLRCFVLFFLNRPSERIGTVQKKETKDE